jgi:hypothetical protein
MSESHHGVGRRSPDRPGQPGAVSAVTSRSERRARPWQQSDAPATRWFAPACIAHNAACFSGYRRTRAGTPQTADRHGTFLPTRGGSVGRDGTFS